MAEDYVMGEDVVKNRGGSSRVGYRLAIAAEVGWGKIEQVLSQTWLYMRFAGIWSQCSFENVSRPVDIWDSTPMNMMPEQLGPCSQPLSPIRICNYEEERMKLPRHIQHIRPKKYLGTTRTRLCFPSVSILDVLLYIRWFQGDTTMT